MAPKDYRPVAILPILSKLLEKAMVVELVSYMVNNNNHHVIQLTKTSMRQMITTWVEGHEDGDMTGVRMIDKNAECGGH